MRQVFADTTYWIGFVNSRDQLHKSVVRVMRGLAPVRIVTSEMVFTELLNTVSNDSYLRDTAAEVVDDFRGNTGATVVAQTVEQFESALGLYRRSVDKEWSLTDCASFLIMEEMGIREALTYDQHFEQAGFKALLR
ncbi:MAG: PIN domain-containing protein [Candidatus Acidiferrum sp.]